MQLQWFLSLGDHFIVALEDASLVQMNTVVSGTNISVQGRRTEVLNPVNVNPRRSLPSSGHCKHSHGRWIILHCC